MKKSKELGGNNFSNSLLFKKFRYNSLTIIKRRGCFGRHCYAIGCISLIPFLEFLSGNFVKEFLGIPANRSEILFLSVTGKSGQSRNSLEYARKPTRCCPWDNFYLGVTLILSYIFSGKDSSSIQSPHVSFLDSLFFPTPSIYFGGPNNTFSSQSALRKK